MTQPSSKVQQALSIALLRILKSPDLSPEDAEWIQQFALRTISEFSLNHDKDEAPKPSIAALDMWVCRAAPPPPDTPHKTTNGRR